VKIRGHRIELGDVEAALASLPGVVEAAVLAVAGRDGAELAACVSGPAAAVPDAEDALLLALAEALPAYMLPHQVYFFGELPKNGNGKTDRKALLGKVEALLREQT